MYKKSDLVFSFYIKIFIVSGYIFDFINLRNIVFLMYGEI